MQTKHIEKLEELNGYEWYHNGRDFYLDGSISSKSKLVLIEKNYIDSDGEMEDRRSKFFSLKNLTELEFYGLKVVLNEKPKLTRKEQERISRESYFARDMNGNLYEYLDKPQQSKEFGRWQTDYAFIQINSDLFTFITWESGKAWSKAELMELEVMDQ